MKEFAVHALEFGKKTAANELNEKAGSTPISDKAQMELEIFEEMRRRDDQLRSIVVDTTKNGLSTAATAVAVGAVLYGLLAEFNANKSKNLADFSVTNFYQQGRLIEHLRYEKKIQSYMRSEILDSQICDMCLALDGRIIPKDDPFKNLKQVHWNCRGIWIAILSNEADVLPSPKPLPQSIQRRFQTQNGLPVTNAFKQFRVNSTVPVLKSSRAFEKLKEGGVIGRRALEGGKLVTKSNALNKDKFIGAPSLPSLFRQVSKDSIQEVKTGDALLKSFGSQFKTQKEFEKQILSRAPVQAGQEYVNLFAYELQSVKLNTLFPTKNVASGVQSTQYDKDNIKKITSGILDGAFIPPIWVDPDNGILDGHHRYESYKGLGVDEIHVLKVVLPKKKSQVGRIINAKKFIK